jgi:hypothetical protein
MKNIAISKYMTAKEIKQTLDCSTGKAYEIFNSLVPINIGGRGKRVLRSKFEDWERHATTMAREQQQDREELQARANSISQSERTLKMIRQESRAAYRRAQAQQGVQHA